MKQYHKENQDIFNGFKKVLLQHYNEKTTLCDKHNNNFDPNIPYPSELDCEIHNKTFTTSINFSTELRQFNNINIKYKQWEFNKKLRIRSNDNPIKTIETIAKTIANQITNYIYIENCIKNENRRTN